MAGLEGCHLDVLLRDTLARTLQVNEALTEGAGSDNDTVISYLNHVEANGIDITPQPEPLQITGFKIGCVVCGGCSTVNLNPDFTAIKVPAMCRVSDLKPGDARMGNNLLSDTGQQG